MNHRFRYGRIPLFLLVTALCAWLELRGNALPFSDGKGRPSGGQLQITQIKWDDWRTDTLGCYGRRWTYLDSLERSALIGTPMDTVLKYLGAPGKIEHYETNTRLLGIFPKKYTIPYHLYPITSNCISREPWVAIRIYYDRKGRVMGYARQNP